MSNQKWVFLKLTCVEYPQDDHFGHFLAYVSLIPFAIIVSMVTVLFTNRELSALFFFVGQLINETLNYILKNFFQESRPVNEFRLVPTHQKYGMPSQHTQFQAFFSSFCILYVLFKRSNSNLFFKICTLFLNMSLIGLVTYSRIYLIYHTWTQCIVGLFVGFFWSLVWFWLVFLLFEPKFFKNIISWPISRALGINHTKLIKSKNKKQKR